MNLDERLEHLETVFTGKYLDVRKYHLRLPDGRKAVREIVHVRDSVAVLPVDPEGRVILVRQHRPAVGKTLIEIPAGLLDEGESPEEAALRECEEETGYRPGRLEKLITYAHAEGYSTGWMTLFVGSDLVHTGRIRLDRTENLHAVCLPFPELARKVRANEIVDSKTILSVTLGKAWLGVGKSS
ncbi:MAG TPA: NUDIX hydrolase [bacterium]|nr:NUDIX hydrolase [bacterium]